jgi:4-amino-4-deoxy-L-arabinose transferase-like glycosyltransferase
MKRSFGLRARLVEEAGIKQGRSGKSAGLVGSLSLAVLVVAELALAVSLFLSRAGNVGVVDEDAYISFRYAQNLLAGEGLVFNPDGQKVEGITNLLWTLLVAAGSWVTGVGLPGVSVALGLVFGVLTLVLAWAWGFEELVGSGVSRAPAAVGAGAAPLLLAVAPGFAFYAASGLEVVFFGFLVMAGLYFLRVGGKLWCALLGSLLLGAAAMTRPEGALVLFFAGAAYVLMPGGDRWRRMLAAAVPGGLALAGVTLWRLYYYGALIPNTAFAKAGGFEVMERWGIPYIVDTARENWFPVAWLLILLGAVAHRGFLKRNLAVMGLVPVWAAYVVYAGGDYMPFGRFVQPMLPVLYTLAVVGVGLVFSSLVGSSTRTRSVLGGASVALPVLVGLSVFVAGMPEQVQAEKEHGDYLRAMTERRHAAADWFEENAPDALVARDGVGAFGYYSDLRLLDMLGLNNSYIAHNGKSYPGLKPGHQTSDGDYILSRKPDYIMVPEVKPPFTFASEKELANTPGFYEQYDRFAIDLSTGDRTYLWKRVEGE